MKNLITITLLFLFSYNAQAQVTLEHSYTEAISFSNDYYASVANNVVTVYSSNHSVYKTIRIYPDIGTTVTILNFGTTNLFNSDPKMEILLSYIMSDNTKKLMLINEDKVTIQEWAGAYSGWVKNVDGQGKLIVNYLNPTKTEIYSLHSTVSLKNIEQTNSNLGQSYPNPANFSLTIPYTINSNNNATMSIYNVNGVLVDEFIISPNFNSLILDTSNYPSGTYIYTIGSETKKLIITK